METIKILSPKLSNIQKSLWGAMPGFSVPLDKIEFWPHCLPVSPASTNSTSSRKSPSMLQPSGAPSPRATAYGTVISPNHNPPNQIVSCPRHGPDTLLTGLHNSKPTQAHRVRIGEKARQGRLNWEMGQGGGQGTELWEVWL